jgi:hypothetical protein
VPLLTLQSDKSKTQFQDRDTLDVFGSKLVKKNILHDYQKEWNIQSLDGLTGLRSARRASGEVLWFGDLKAWFKRIARQKDAIIVGILLTLSVQVLIRVMALFL